MIYYHWMKKGERDFWNINKPWINKKLSDLFQILIRFNQIGVLLISHRTGPAPIWIQTSIVSFLRLLDESNIPSKEKNKRLFHSDVVDYRWLRNGSYFLKFNNDSRHNENKKDTILNIY